MKSCRVYVSETGLEIIAEGWNSSRVEGMTCFGVDFRIADGGGGSVMGACTGVEIHGS